MNENDDGFQYYADFVTQQLAAEENAAAGLTGRATSTITTSGALVTLLLAIGAVAQEYGKFQLNTATTVLLVSGLFLYLCSSLMSLAVLAPTLRRSVDAQEMASEFRSGWQDPPSKARRKTMATEIELLTEIQEVNDRKGSRLFISVASQAIATACTTGAVAIIIASA
ncbi:hypothetical protein JOD57_000051 [Geodermatophilus bullaregiensis]|uniref:hypothetical protein n=1 Tax=Geodermatophilus bullaregiensis TaxID=1564160 RepID=UPI0019565B6B|nr:hypothetical protein [Geodermatophilus bullaregiensis]MBM7804214.1 hypothetical protein [Geodermatophilus bullaregiensis]